MINLKNYKEMDCPVCGKFYFSELDEIDVEIMDFVQCRECGWKNDLYQFKNPDSRNGINKKSLNEYKQEYNNLLSGNPDYSFSKQTHKNQSHVCPVCKKYKFSQISSFFVCPQCGWIDDDLMEAEPDKWAGCANDLCLNDFIKRYKTLVKENPNYRYSINKFN